MRYNPRPVRRLGRILLNVPTVLSLLLCLATATLWASSYRASEQVDWEGPAGEVHARASRGTLLTCQASTGPRPTALSHSRSAPPASVGVTFAVALRGGHLSAQQQSVAFR
jgi:hypothetical protein